MMNTKSELLNSTLEPWTIQPTMRERSAGRLLRDGEGHETQTETKVEENSSLVTGGEETKAEETKTEETKTEETKVEETKAEETKVEPLTLENLAVPEGFEVQPELADKFLEILNGDMSPKDRADALLALHGETLNAASEAGSKAWEDMQNQWRDEVKADPEIGGAKLQPVLTNIGKLLDEFGDPDLKGVFDMTGAGNNPHIIKFLNKIADTLTEGKFFKAGAPGASDPDAAAKRLFPSAN